MAKTIGSFAIESNMAGLTTSAIESPIKTSASTIASSSVSIFLSVANSNFSEDKFSLSLRMTPLLSIITIFLAEAPKALYNLVQETAAAPAPLITMRTSSIFFSVISSAFNKAAADIIAVPCWSSCITGISNSSFNLLSISKASGALMSSRLIPPKVGAMILTVSINLSTSLVSNSISILSISAKILNNNDFPSITGFEASGPMSPNPKTAVPLVITATKFPFEVYL